MIAYISGTILHVMPQTIIIDTGSIGYEVSVTQESEYCTGQKVSLFIHYHFSQDHGARLFGFSSVHEKDVFGLIITCSGIGPKMALTILSSLSYTDFIQAVCEKNIKVLSSVSGIGAKKAELIAMHLKDKAQHIAQKIPQQDLSRSYKDIHKAEQALLSMGYKKHEIESAFDHVRKIHHDKEMSFNMMLRLSLSFLSKKIT
jgi:Holliday junction DNA helicase RuvA